MRRGVTIRTVINSMEFNGQPKDAMQEAVRDALIAFMAATAQAQAEATKEAQKAGIAAARDSSEVTAYKGRKPSFTAAEVAKVRDLLGQGMSVTNVARELGRSRQTVYRIKDDPQAVEKALQLWAAA